MGHQITRRHRAAPPSRQARIEARWDRLLRHVMALPERPLPGILPARECLWCLAESGQARNPLATHGVCRRHESVMRVAWFAGVTVAASAAQAGG